MMVAGTTTPLRIELQVAADEAVVPDDAVWEAWVSAALSAGGHPASGVVTVRLVTEEESATLNLSFRDKPGSTNVLAFPGPGDELPTAHFDELGGEPGDDQGEAMVEAELGDLVICLPVACREADEQNKRLVAHLAHLVVHGTLHLIGYDHQQEVDAERMESLEVRIMGEFGFANPYAHTERMNDA